MNVTFFFSAKKKVTKEKTRDLVPRYNGCALAMPVLPARYTMSHSFGGVLLVRLFLLLSLLYLFLSAKKLRTKAGRTMVGLCDCKGIAILAEAVAYADEVGQDVAARGSACLQGKGLVRQRSLFADLIFWLLFDQAKSNSPPAIERIDVDF